MLRPIAAFVIALLLSFVLIELSGAGEATQCSTSPRHRLTHSHWSMRTIDGRRCWFEGHLSQSKRLYWRERDVDNGEEIVPMTVWNELVPVPVLYAEAPSRIDQAWQDLQFEPWWRDASVGQWQR